MNKNIQTLNQFREKPFHLSIKQPFYKTEKKLIQDQALIQNHPIQFYPTSNKPPFIPKLKRYCSQQDIKTKTSTTQVQSNFLYEVQHSKIQSSQIKGRPSFDSNFLKQVQKSPRDKELSNKVKDKELEVNKKKGIQLIQKKVNRNYNLKETASTLCADIPIKQSNKYPSFVKMKQQRKFSQSIGNFNRQSFWDYKKLGAGKFGNVYFVREKTTGMGLAMKVFQKSKIIQQNYLQQFIRELKIQTFLNHPSIIKIYGFFHDQLCIYVLMELGCDGHLYKIIQQNRILSEESTSYIVKSLLTGLNYMHTFKIVHRDIKPQNIVLVHGSVKICDFGWAVNIKEDLRSTFCGTPFYFSPQLLKGEGYDEKVDLWAIGIIAYELHLGKSPFGITEKKDLHKIMTDQIKLPMKGVSQWFRQFICLILEKDPNKRYSSEKLLKLNFFTKYSGIQTCEDLFY